MRPHEKVAVSQLMSRGGLRPHSDTAQHWLGWLEGRDLKLAWLICINYTRIISGGFKDISCIKRFGSGNDNSMVHMSDLGGYVEFTPKCIIVRGEGEVSEGCHLILIMDVPPSNIA